MWRRMLYWQGTFGYPRLTVINYASQPLSILSTLESALQNASTAAIIQVAEGGVSSFSTIPAGGAYPSVAQAAELTFLDVNSEAFKLTLPAPARSIFLADGVTVDPAQLATILAAALFDHLVSPQGAAVASVVSGVLNGPAVPGSTLT